MSLIFPNFPGRNLYAALIRRCMHKGLELFSYLNLKEKDRTLPSFSNPLPSPAPAFPFEGGKRKVSTCCQQSFFGIILNGSILTSPLF